MEPVNHRMDWPLLKTLRFDVVVLCLLVLITVIYAQDTRHFQLDIDLNSRSVDMTQKHVAEEPTSVSHFQIKGMSFHAIEIFLVIIILAVALRRISERDFHFERTHLDLWFGVWLLYGIFELVRGISFHGDYSVAFHDFSLVYYVVFFYVAREIWSDWQKVQGLLLVFAVACGVKVFMGVWNYLFNINFAPGDGIDWPQFGKFSPNIAGANILLMLLVGVAVWRLLQKHKRAVYLLLSFSTFALILTQQRSLLLAFLTGFGLLVMGARLCGLPKPLGMHWLIVGALVVGGVLYEVKAVINFSNADAVSNSFSSMWTKSAADARVANKASVHFRQDAWKEAWRRILQSPLLGEGFGQKFKFYDSSQEKWWTVQPHNTYMTILNKMGLLGLSILFVIHFIFYKVLYEALSQPWSRTSKAYLLGLTAATTALLTYGAFNILFERRSISMIYWLLMGVNFNLAQLCFKENDSRSIMSRI